MKSLFKDEKRVEAINYLSEFIIQGAKNCALVINNINIITQNLEIFSKPSALISSWQKNLFFYTFNDLSKNNNVDFNSISKENYKKLELLFFNYFVSIIPIYFEKVSYKDIIGPNKNYKWTIDDYNLLSSETIKKWYLKEFEHSSIFDKNIRSLESNVQSTSKKFNRTILLKKSIFSNQKKIDEILSPNKLIFEIEKYIPNIENEYQNVLFKYYSTEFIKALPEIFNLCEDHFYNEGAFIHKFFKWY